MKKITFLFLVFAISISVLAQDNQPTLNKLWQFTTPASSTEEKDVRNGFDYYNGELFLASRRTQAADGFTGDIVIYNASTGEPVISNGNIAQLVDNTTINMAWAGGDVAIDDNGAIYCIAGNNAAIIKWDSKEATGSSTFATLPATGAWAFHVLVDNTGNGCIVAAPQNTSTVYYIPVANNVAGTTVTLTLSNPLGAVPRPFILNTKTFWIDGSAIKPTLITLNDDLSIKSEQALTTSAIFSGVNGVAQFNLNEKTYLILAANNHGSFGSVPKHSVGLFELDKESFTVTMIGDYFPQDIGGKTDNSHFVKPIVQVGENEAYIYLMAGINGMAAYKLTVPQQGNEINNVDADNIKLIRTAEGIEITLDEASTVELYNINGQLLDKRVATGTYKYSLESGMYIIRINNKPIKFIK